MRTSKKKTDITDRETDPNRQHWEMVEKGEVNKEKNMLDAAKKETSARSMARKKGT